MQRSGRRGRKEGPRSRPVSRVLFPPGQTGDGHFSRTPIARRLKRSTRRSKADRAGPRVKASELVASLDPCLLFDLAPGGVCLARPVTRPAGELLPHRFTLTAPRTLGTAQGVQQRGGLLSVALSLASRPVGVTHHPALWSPDFPLAPQVSGRYGGPCLGSQRPSGRLRNPV